MTREESMSFRQVTSETLDTEKAAQRASVRLKPKRRPEKRILSVSRRQERMASSSCSLRGWLLLRRSPVWKLRNGGGGGGGRPRFRLLKGSNMRSGSSWTGSAALPASMTDFPGSSSLPRRVYRALKNNSISVIFVMLPYRFTITTGHRDWFERKAAEAGDLRN